MNWKEYITGLKFANQEITFGFNLPAKDETLQELKIQFRLNELPDDLEELYRQTNGIDEFHKEQKTGELIWSAGRVIKTNKEFRNFKDFKELYMSFDQLLFIGDTGNGDLFGFVTLNGMFDRHDIFTWNHENDNRTCAAPSLKRFIEWWANGTINI
jgi:hypothetical protein